jgi:hypothetical protein
MSIYPVKISTWFKEGEVEFDIIKALFKFLEMENSNRCITCGRIVTFEDAFMMHAVPWGYGDYSVWCSTCI